MLRLVARTGYLRSRGIDASHFLAERNNHVILRSCIFCKFKSSVAQAVEEYDSPLAKKQTNKEIRRLTHVRNVGVFAHVDAGKTTVTERMLALAGVVRRVGSVDDGNTVTDYLPAERERGITIQSAAISFDWGWHNNKTGDDYDPNDNVEIHLIDTPGHVDFSVEVNRSAAVLDGAVLVVDAVAGVQAQTETVWRAMTRPSLNNHDVSPRTVDTETDPCRGYEPLPCLAVINKMDKEGCNFGSAIQSLQRKLPGANPVAMQLPLFRAEGKSGSGSNLVESNIVAVSIDESGSIPGDFVGCVDLVHMRMIIWPDVSSAALANVDECTPKVIPLLDSATHKPFDPNCHVTREALTAREDLIASLAEVDESIEEYFLNEQEPSNAELRAALRRATLDRKALPVMSAAALKGKGIEPILDSVADLLPSPLDRLPPALITYDEEDRNKSSKSGSEVEKSSAAKKAVAFGHPLHPSLLALAFKVVHMKGRGGSGDGRVVFARVYSGQMKTKDTLQVLSPPAPGEAPEKPRTERVGGMLELAGGRFSNIEDGVCKSGEVCALVGLKTVVTGDTIFMGASPGGDKRSRKKAAKGTSNNSVYLAGVASPKPVLKVRLETETAEEQTKLSEALALLAIEDPSLLVEETDSATLLSGLGELHIEVVLDRLYREFGLQVTCGSPSVAYRETITEGIETEGLLNYDRLIGGTRLQAAVHLYLEPHVPSENTFPDSSCMLLSEPLVTVGQEARKFLGVDQSASEEDLIYYSDVFKALILGCQGALKRGPLGSYPMSNVRCHVESVDAEGGLAALNALPGALRAAAAHAVTDTLHNNKYSCTMLEPSMTLEVTLPSDSVGAVVSDLTGRRGTIGDVIIGETGDQVVAAHSKALLHGEVPLVEILGYANSLRSITGGEGAFSAEYKGHTPCEI
mmetsp:Transcript_16727/g.23603  ORF Transcript_16727/g.23603 Transcript_16727/m.23603 type:complete len:917 (+) Transcript_16727:127-2877(+)